MINLKETGDMLQEGISKTSREIWLAGLGAFATVDKEGTKLFNKFVERGRELSEGSDAVKTNGEPAATYISEKKDQLAHEIFSKMENATSYVRHKINALSEPAANSSGGEVQSLSEKVDKLADMVATLVQKMDESTKAGAKKAAL